MVLANFDMYGQDTFQAFQTMAVIVQAGAVFGVFIKARNKQTKNIALSALKHTLNIFLFIFIITLVINGIIEIIGQENLANIVSKNIILGPIVAGIIGLIPNCASSVVLTELFVENVILISGLCVNAGVGLLVLFKTNENKKENLKIIGLLYAIGVISGLILEIII